MPACEQLGREQEVLGLKNENIKDSRAENDHAFSFDIDDSIPLLRYMLMLSEDLFVSYFC
jgi:hypothetical protein